MPQPVYPPLALETTPQGHHTSALYIAEDIGREGLLMLVYRPGISGIMDYRQGTEEIWQRCHPLRRDTVCRRRGRIGLGLG